jgi:ligand-binding sensor protein
MVIMKDISYYNRPSDDGDIENIQKAGGASPSRPAGDGLDEKTYVKETEMSELTVYEVQSRETWQELLDKAQSAVGMPAALLDPNNAILQSSGERNELCTEIRSRKEALPVICGQSQKFMAETARTQKAPVVEICEGGLAKLVVPIFREEKYLGCLTTCGSVHPNTEVEVFLIGKATGMDEDAIGAMAKKVPTVKKEDLEKLGEDLFHRVNA